ASSRTMAPVRTLAPEALASSCGSVPSPVVSVTKTGAGAVAAAAAAAAGGTSVAAAAVRVGCPRVAAASGASVASKDRSSQRAAGPDRRGCRARGHEGRPEATGLDQVGALGTAGEQRLRALIHADATDLRGRELAADPGRAFQHGDADRCPVHRLAAQEERR